MMLFVDLKLTSQTKGSSVNIGFPLTKTPLKDSQIRAVIRKNKTELQALVEDGKCMFMQVLVFDQGHYHTCQLFKISVGNFAHIDILQN